MTFNELLRKLARCQSKLADDLIPDEEQGMIQERLQRLERWTYAPIREKESYIDYMRERERSRVPVESYDYE